MTITGFPENRTSDLARRTAALAEKSL